MSEWRARPCPDRPELAALLKKAAEWWKTATPEEKREMHRAQRKSWVIGEMMLEHPEMTREETESLYENAIGWRA